MTEAAIQRKLDLMSEATEKALASEYADARTVVKARLAELFERYGSANISEMAKANRLNDLLAFLERELSDLGFTFTQEMADQLGNQYEYAFTNYGSVIETQYGEPINWGVVNRDTIAALMKNPTVAGLSVTDTITATQAAFLQSVKQTMVQGMIQGEGYDKIARRITEVFDIGYNKAIQIVRTEGTRASGEGQSAAYDRAEELGVEIRRVWSAAVNSDRTRPDHIALDGQYIEPDGTVRKKNGDKVASNGRFILVTGDNKGSQTDYPGGFGIPAQDRNCRCRVVAEVVTE